MTREKTFFKKAVTSGENQSESLTNSLNTVKTELKTLQAKQSTNVNLLQMLTSHNNHDNTVHIRKYLRANLNPSEIRELRSSAASEESETGLFEVRSELIALLVKIGVLVPENGAYTKNDGFKEFVQGLD